MLASSDNPIVFLSGWGFKPSIWHSFAKKLKHRNYFFYDLPNECSNLTSLSKIIGKHLPENSTIIAWSLGGLFAVTLCHQFPDKIKYLITTASTPKFTIGVNWLGISEKKMLKFNQEAETNLPCLMKKFQAMAVPYELNDHLLSFQNQSSLLFYLDLLFKADVRNLYFHLTTPALHIFGDQDKILSPGCAKQISIHYPAHGVQIIKGAGHAPFLSHAQEFMQCINAFLVSHP